MAHSRRSIAILALLAMLFITAGCGLESGDSGSTDEEGNFQPEDTPEFMVHTGPGGGSDIFVRDFIQMMRSEGIIDENWPVRNEDAGEGAGAMNHLMTNDGATDIISAMTTTWITTPLTIEGATVTVDDLTPIAGLIIEPEVMAVAADAPYESLTDFIDDAKEQPGELVQTGGSTTEVGALNGETIQAATDTEWKFLSFEEVGQRVTALLNGDAHMMFGSAADFASQVDAGKLKVIATISPDPSPVYPDAPTVEDEGIDAELVAQVRGVMGPPNMPDEAVEYYQGLFEETLQTQAWEDYAEKNGLVTQFLVGEEWSSYLEDQVTKVEEALKTADL